MIDSMNVTLLQSDDLLTFGQRSVGIFSEVPKEKHALSSFVSKALVAEENYSKAFERESKNPYTPKLFEKDFVRDNRFYGFRYYVESFSFHPDVQIAEASNKILDIIRKHGWTAPSLSYKAQTAAVTKIISELKSKCWPEIDLVNAKDWFGFMETSQNDFEAVQKESVQNTKNNGPTLLETRSVMVKCIKDLFKMADLKLTEEPNSEEYKAYVSAINELISITMTTARANATRQANKKKNGKTTDNNQTDVK